MPKSRATTEPQARLFETRNDLDADVRQQVCAVLNQELADLFDLFSQTKQAHWNVKGMNFYQLHLLFDALAEQVEGHIDSVAERITALGGVARGTARMAAEHSQVEEYSLDTVSGRDHVEALSDRYATVANFTRSAIGRVDDLGDDDTVDLLTEVSRDLDKQLWFLEAHLQD